MYAAMSAALISNSFKLLGDPQDSDARAAIEAAFGLSFYTWGCRSRPEDWNPMHIIDTLRAYTNICNQRVLADCLLLVYAECLSSQINTSAGDRWQVWGFQTTTSLLPSGALHGDNEIWSGFSSQPLFENQSGNGLYLPICNQLLMANIVQINQLCEKRTGENEIRLCDWVTMCEHYPCLRQNRRAQAE